jgi:uncharacterized phage protein gp47/JayE
MGNTPSGSILTLVSPLPEIESKASIFEDSLTRGLTGGSDAESKESLLGRLLHKIRKPSLGGSKSDYEFWTRELPGISRVWVLPNAMGPGSVGVTFTTDNIEDPIPSPEKIAQVTANIEEKRPITARVYVYPLNAAPIDFEIKILPSDPNTKNKVKNALLKLFFHEAHPGGQILLSHIHRAILKAAEIEDYTIVEPKNDIQIGIGQLATLGRVQWVT